MAKKITKDAVRRIQSHADRTGQNQDFKARIQSAHDRQVNQQSEPSTGNQQSDGSSEAK